MNIDKEKFNYFQDRIFDEKIDTKFQKKYGDMFYLLLDFIKDNNIQINIYNNDIYIYEEDDYLIDIDYCVSILTMSLFCSLQSTNNLVLQKNIPSKYLTNLITILDLKPKELNTISIFSRVIRLFRKHNDISSSIITELSNQINYNNNYDKIYYTISKLICKYFNPNEKFVHWNTIGFYSFILSIQNENNKLELINKYLKYLIKFIDYGFNKYNFFENPNYRTFIEY